MDRIVNNIQLTWKLARMLQTYKTCNSMVEFLKYEFYNKLLDGVTLFKIILDITWTQSYINLYLYITKNWSVTFIVITF